jgi:hypothetical protein
MGNPSMPEEASRPGEHQPEEYRYDLNPDFMAGQNVGLQGQHPEKAEGIRTAYDVKGAHRRLQELEDDELKQIPVLPRGSRLEQGATYIDLRAHDPHEFTARGDMEAAPDNWYVPKSEVDYQLWNRLTGVDNPERLGEAGE